MHWAVAATAACLLACTAFEAKACAPRPLAAASGNPENPNDVADPVVRAQLAKIAPGVAVMLHRDDLRGSVWNEKAQGYAYYRVVPTSLSGYTDDGQPYCTRDDIRRYHHAAPSTPDAQLAKPGMENLVPGASEWAIGRCTAFRVDVDKVVTAAHCAARCDTSVFVFGFTRDAKGRVNSAAIPANRVYRCDSLYGATKTNISEPTWRTSQDWAVLYTTRDIAPSIPTLALSGPKEQTVAPDDPIVMLGHPSGRAMVLLGAANVVEVGAASFSTNLKSFTGASGSPVFRLADLKAKKAIVMGVHTAGDAEIKELKLPGERSCLIVERCDPTLAANRKTCEGSLANHAKMVAAHLSLVAKDDEASTAQPASR